MKNPEILDGTGDMINLFGFGFARAKGQIDKMVYQEIEEVSYASGTCMFLPRKIIDEIGYFDEKLFAHMEEIDYHWRCQLNGYSVYVNPQSTIYHL